MKKRISVILIFYVLFASCSAFGPSFRGEIVEPLAAAPEIHLTDQNGRPFQLSELNGKVVLVFFGFTNCVDECPLTLAHIKQAREILGDSAQDVQVVLVSTDPIRDTPKVLQEYLNKFDPGYLGIPGTQDQLQAVWTNYGVIVLDGGETHSSFIYVIDKSGNLRLKFDAETAPEDMASDLKTLLAEN